MKLGQVFDPRNNALNAWRLALAAEVILWHSFPLTGRFVSYEPVRQLLFSLGVDGFFAVSGFLVTSSWLRHPRIRDYSAARALRIFPGFYVCLIMTAFVIAPLSVAIQGGSATKLLSSKAPFEYVLMNCALLILKPDVGGTPRGVPSSGRLERFAVDADMGGVLLHRCCGVRRGRAAHSPMVSSHDHGPGSGLGGACYRR